MSVLSIKPNGILMKISVAYKIPPRALLNLEIDKDLHIKNYLKDHRVMAMSTIAALTLGGRWNIHNPESIKTSFPSFFKILKKDLGSKINLWS